MKIHIFVQYIFLLVLFLVTPFFVTPVSADITVTKRIQSGADDVGYTGGTATPNGTALGIGKSITNPISASMRFPDLAIPDNAIITSAKIDFVRQGGTNAVTVNAKIYAEDTDNAVAPTTDGEFATLLTNLTTTAVDWDFLTNSTWGEPLESVDFTDVIQEVVDRAGWESGNAIQVVIIDDGSPSYYSQTVHSYNLSSTDAPLLTITYTTPNIAPVANDDTSQTLFETGRLINVLSNDTDANSDDLSISSVSDPSNGTTAIESGQVRYTPDDDYSGTDTFTYVVSDGRGGTDTGSVTVTVHGDTNYHTFEVDFTKSDLPTLNYYDLTANIYVGTASSVLVTDEDNNTISSSYSSGTGYVQFTTAENTVNVQVEGMTSLEGFGDYTFETLKYGKNWAWSHGMDDNTYLEAQIALMEAKGWRGTLNIITNSVHDSREESWIEDAPDIRTHIANGWAIGNHGAASECVSDDTEVLTNDILTGYNRLSAIATTSAIPNYKITSFAAPCFRSQYNPLFNSIKSGGETTMLVNETGSGAGIHLVDDLSGGASNYSSGDFSAVAITFDSNLSRDTNLGYQDAEFIDIVDWVSSNTSSSRHIWFNSLTHGNQEDDLGTAADYIYDNYGPDGTDEVWVAPLEEIYAYLYVRDNTTADVNSLQVVDSSFPELSAISVTPGENSAVITWTTDEIASTQVLYGTSSSLGSQTTEVDTSTRVTSHSQTLTGLLACTTYSYRVKSTDATTNASQSTTATFTTTGCLNSSSVVSNTAQTVEVSSGGTVTHTNGSLTVSVLAPASYNESDADIQVKQLSTGAASTGTRPSGKSLVNSQVVDIKVISGGSYVSEVDQAVTVTMNYSQSDANNYDSDTFIIYRYNGSEWVALDNCSVNTTNRTVSCTTTNFSVFALMGTESENESNDSGSSGNNDSSGSSSHTAVSNVSSPNCTVEVSKDVITINSIETHQTSTTIYFTPAKNKVSYYYVAYGLLATAEEYGMTFDAPSVDSQLTVQLNHLKPGKAYYVKIRAGNGCQPGEWSSTQSFKTDYGGNTSAIEEIQRQAKKTLDQVTKVVNPTNESNQNNTQKSNQLPTDAKPTAQQTPQKSSEGKNSINFLQKIMQFFANLFKR